MHDPRRRRWLEQLEPVFARELRLARTDRGISQELLVAFVNQSFKLNWHQTTLAKVEAGERAIKLREALVLCEALEIPLRQLTGEDELPVVGWSS
ncbi:helix-turn-helix domain-containing protein [Cellulomonas sp. Leaf395]|uniref:helix-turn-helix domain-containing protein n=1 Tax=Cellulomonas sp. Leaf395 TaxID=1736362 RepID=UPI0007019B6B|nr:helix-turn-helix transcriptional regulator [Cellulomonas sp. Leaf395]KQS96980.1 hypothetical protein ASG23_15360 [Cellulomonas sp. Leaf395]